MTDEDEPRLVTSRFGCVLMAIEMSGLIVLLVAFSIAAWRLVT